MIIGITGTIGAGKGAVVEYLVREKGFAHFSARDLLRDEITERGMPINRDTMVRVGNDLRKTFGPQVIAERLLLRAKETGQDAVIESIRSPGEVVYLRLEPSFRLWAIDADPRLRYERAVLRGSETDHVSFERFLSDEAREMNGADPFSQNLRECIAQADTVLYNNEGIRELTERLEHALAESLA